MTAPQRRLVAYPIAAAPRPVLPRRQLAPNRVLSFAYRVLFWICLVVLATWWSHRPHPWTLDDATAHVPSHYTTITP